MGQRQVLIVHKDHVLDVHGPNSGAEMATRFLARTIASLGVRVVVAAQLKGTEETVDGVEYWDLGPGYDTLGAIERMAAEGAFHLISSGRAQPLLESRREPRCLSRILISHDRSGNDTGIKPEVLLRVIDYVVCVSDAQREVFLKAGADPKKVVTLFNGVDLELFQPGLPEQRNYRRLVFVGALVEDKGIHWLIESFCRLKPKFPDLTLDVYGSSDLWGRKRLFDEQDIQRRVPGVTFHGKVSQEVIAKAYREGGLCVIPSIWFDPFPLTALEAQACGCPVLTFDVGGLKEGVLDGHSAMVMKEITPDVLTSHLEHLLTNPQKLKGFAATALRECRPRFTWEKVAQGVLDLGTAAEQSRGHGESTVGPKLREGRLGVVTTWNQACGLATYARYLFSNLDPDSYVVLAEDVPSANPGESSNEPIVERCWRRGEADLSALERAIKKHNISLLHLNCQPGFFPQPAFGDLLQKLRSQGVVVVAHLHNTFTLETSMQKLVTNVDRVVVHAPENRLEAIANGACPEHVVVVPHGVHALAPCGDAERKALRTRLGIPLNALALTAFGFIQPHKGMEGIVESVAHLKQKGVDAHGYIVGEVMPADPNSQPYCEALKELATRHGISDCITILNRFVSEEEVGAYLQASDLVLMNYRSQHYEASGACSLAVGAGALVATSIAPAFQPFGDAVWHLSAGYPVPLSVEILFSNAALRKQISANAQRYVEQYSWKQIAQRIRALYQDVGIKPVVIRREKVVAMAPIMHQSSPSLKVLIQNRPNAWTQAGGDTVVMEKLVTGLRAHGIEVTVDLEGRQDPASYDIAHLFNFALPELLRKQAERCVNAKVPFVVTTLCEDVPTFHNQSWEAARILIEYVTHSKSKEWLKSRWEGVNKVAPSPRFDNQWVAERAAALFANGAEEKRLLEQTYPGLRSVREVPLGFDVTPAADASLFINEYGVRDFVLCVGRIETRKNQLMLLKALEDSELPVVLAGGGFTYQPEYEQAVRAFKRKGPTIMAGRPSPQMLASAYAACRVHALPSWYELPGLVTLEAAACGKNVVVCERGTTPDYFGELAFYAEPSSWRSIANAVKAAYYSPVIPGLKEHVQRYTWSATISETIKWYEAVVSASGRKNASPVGVASPTISTTSSGLPSWFVPGVTSVASPAQTMPSATQPTTSAPSSVPSASSSRPSSAAPSWGPMTTPAASTPMAPEFDQVLTQGEEAAKRGEFAEAHTLLAKAEQLHPGSSRCLRARGAVFLAEQKRSEAKAYFDRALALDPKEVRAVIGLGMCASFEGRHAEGHDYFARALAIDPEQTTALHQLVQCAHAIGRFDALEGALRRYLERHATDAEFQFCLAGCLYRRGNLSEASMWVERVLAAQPSHRGASELKAMLAKPASSSSATQASFSGTMQSPVMPATTVATSAQVIPAQPSWLAASKSGAVAVTVPTQAPTPADSRPPSMQIRETPLPGFSAVEQELDLLEDKKRQQKFEEVAKACDELLGRSTLSASERERAQLLRAETHSMFEEFDRATELYDRVLLANPNSARALCGKGALAAHGNNWASAEQLFIKALAIAPEFDIACAGLGICAAQKGNPELAWDWYRRATRSNPENLRAIYGLIELSYPLKRLGELEQALRAYLEMHPADLKFVYSLAGCLYAQNKVPEAKAEVEKIIVFEPENSKALELQGIIKKRLETGSGAGWQH